MRNTKCSSSKKITLLRILNAMDFNKPFLPFFSLWKSDSLANLDKSGKDLTITIHDFIFEHQELKETHDKIWMTPEERRKSPVPLPTSILFFNGRKLLRNC